MKPDQVRFHHLRDWKCRTVWCAKCGRLVKYWHEHMRLGEE
jgi:hypothetical protein